MIKIELPKSFYSYMIEKQVGYSGYGVFKLKQPISNWLKEKGIKFRRYKKHPYSIFFYNTNDAVLFKLKIGDWENQLSITFGLDTIADEITISVKTRALSATWAYELDDNIKGIYNDK